MKSKGKRKFHIQRELKTDVPPDFRKELSEALKAYGAGRALEKATKISYNTIAAINKDGVATPSAVEKLRNALKKAKQAA